MLNASEETNRGSNLRAGLRTGLLLVGVLVVLAAVVWARRSQPASPGGDAAQDNATASISDSEDSTPPAKIVKTDAEWKTRLTQDQFEVTRHKATERPFTGEYWNNKQAGTYKCVCCGAELFTSDTKYDSGCGWPSFWAASKPANVHTADDLSLGMVRTEVTCQHCGAHLGHLFDDGPQPTGHRYCMNSAAMKFEKKPEGK